MKKSGRRSAESIFYGRMNSPVGTLYVALDGKKVVALTFSQERERSFRASLTSETSRPVRRADDMTQPVITELREYFDGKRRRFSLIPDLSMCTEFQRKVLAVTARIPYGQTRTYGWLAAAPSAPPDVVRCAGCRATQVNAPAGRRR